MVGDWDVVVLRHVATGDGLRSTAQVREDIVHSCLLPKPNLGAVMPGLP